MYIFQKRQEFILNVYITYAQRYLSETFECMGRNVECLKFTSFYQTNSKIIETSLRKLRLHLSPLPEINEDLMLDVQYGVGGITARGC